MTPESRYSSLLGNGWVNTFPRKRTIEERCFLRSAPRALLRNGAVNITAAVNQHATTEGAVFAIRAAPRLYNEGLTHLMKLQLLQNRVLHAIGNLDTCTPVRDLHLAFKIPYVYDYITNYAGDRQMSP
jgi:hypothetical protein